MKLPSSLNQIFKEVYDPEWPHRHIHVYDKTITTPIMESIYSSEEDRRYDLEHPGRWQGQVKQIGETKHVVCNVCDKSEDTVIHLETLWKNIGTSCLKKEI